MTVTREELYLVTQHADRQHPVDDGDTNDHGVADQPFAFPELLPADQVALKTERKEGTIVSCTNDKLRPTFRTQKIFTSLLFTLTARSRVKKMRQIISMLSVKPQGGSQATDLWRGSEEMDRDDGRSTKASNNTTAMMIPKSLGQRKTGEGMDQSIQSWSYF